LVVASSGRRSSAAKSRFSADAQADGAVVLVGGCIDLGEGALPYARGPVREGAASGLSIA
jgi:hypothetical protein